MTKSDEKEETRPLLSSSSNEKGLRTPTKNIFLPLGTFIYSAGLELGSTTLHQYAYNYTGQASSQNTSLFQDHDNQSELSCHRNSSKHQNANQEDAANWLMYFELMEYSIGIPMIILAGIYSDFIGRKFFILLSVFGSAGQLFCMFIVIYFDLHIGYLFISSAISGIVGTHYTFSLASSVLIADTTGTGKARSFHIALIHSYKGVGQVLANLGSGYLIQLTGFVIPSLISSALCFVACFTLSFEKETLTESIKTAKPSFCRSFLRFFGFFCGRGYRKNVQILKFVTNLLCFMMIMCPEVAASSIRTLFILGEPFCFTSEMVGYFGAATDIANHIIGTVLLKLLHLCIHDESSTIIGFLSGIAKFLMIAFSMNAIMIFMSSVVGVFSIVAFSLLRGILSRMISEKFQGALFAVIYFLEAICRLVSNALFLPIYGHTQNFMQTFVFFVMAGFYVIAGLLFLPIAVSNSKERKKTYTLIVNADSTS